MLIIRTDAVTAPTTTDLQSFNQSVCRHLPDRHTQHRHTHSGSSNPPVHIQQDTDLGFLVCTSMRETCPTLGAYDRRTARSGCHLLWTSVVRSVGNFDLKAILA